MKTSPLRSPRDILSAVVASEVEVIRSRDPELSAALDLAPRPIEHEASRPRPGADKPSIPRRALRKAYRILDRVEPLRPFIQKVRSRILERVEAKSKHVPEEPDTLTTIKHSFTIAFTMRSGSNEICNLLAKNGLGTPSEFFQKPFTGGSALALDGFSRIVSRYQVGGIFGSKMAHEHRASLDSQLRKAIPGYTRIDDILPNHKWVWLTRRDKILQAISWCRAEASNDWASRSSASGAKKSSEFTYDFVHILSRVMLIYSSELAWEMYFRENGIEPLKVVYEDFFPNVDQQLARLIHYLGGLPKDRASIDLGTTFAIQRSEKSYQIRQRFVSDLDRLGSDELTFEIGAPLVKWARFLFEFGWRG